MKVKSSEVKSSQWTFLTNHFHILVALSREPDMRISDMSIAIGITQRAVQRILSELVEEGVLKVKKEGRRNKYSINGKKRLKHPLESKHSVGTLLDILA